MANEDYLEAILMLGGSVDVPVRAVDIAEKMNVSKTSVNKAISALKQKGMVAQPHYGGITLTKKGEECGSKVLNRHHVLTRFLHENIGLDVKTAESEACLMEHAISDASFKKWLAFIKKIQNN